MESVAPRFPESLFVVFETMNLSCTSNSSHERVTETSASCSSLDHGRTRQDVEVGSDESDVGEVQNLSTVR